MKIAHIIPGSGGTYYCENCLRDTALMAALRRKGGNILMVPMYLPAYSDEHDEADSAAVFFGGINVYLQETIPFFRRTPRWLDRLFDSGSLLGWLARHAVSTRATGLGQMTLSMLHGPDGNQAKELKRLVNWLADQKRPDVVQISSPLLIGLVSAIKGRLGVPVVCSLQDEDTWLDAIEKPYRDRCWQAIREQVSKVDRFVAVSRHYRDLMQERLRIPSDKLRVVHLGINTDGYQVSSLQTRPATLGYLSKMSRDLGLGTLVDAYVTLKERAGFERLRLWVMGGKTDDDARFVSTLKRQLAAKGMLGDTRFHDDLGREQRQAFLKGLTLMTVPMPRGSAFGLFMLEAMASGVPVVQPHVGAFPEIIQETGGGITYEPNTSEALADTWERLLTDPNRIAAYAARGRESVMERFSIDAMADRFLSVYDETLRTRGPSPSAEGPLTEDNAATEGMQLVTVDNQAGFERWALHADIPCLVDFYSDSCAPCRMLTSTVERLAAKYAGDAVVCRVNLDSVPALAQRFEIKSLPCVLFFDNGEEVDRLIGVHEQKAYEAVLGSMLERHHRSSASGGS